MALSLQAFFCGEHAGGHKYSEVWLSDVDFGGLYHDDKYVVNIKAEDRIESCNEEIRYVTKSLFERLPQEERSLIWRVNVYNAFEDINCRSGDLLVYATNGTGH